MLSDDLANLLVSIHDSITSSWSSGDCNCNFHADADPADLVFIPNATTGNCTVVMSVVKTLKPGDSIAILNTGYGKYAVYVWRMRV